MPRSVKHVGFFTAGQGVGRQRFIQLTENQPQAEIKAAAWAILDSDTSRPFNKPKQDRIAEKVINHLGG